MSDSTSPPALDLPLEEVALDPLAKSLFEASDDCVQLLDRDGRLLSMNVNGRRLMEIDDFGPLQGQPWPAFWPERERPMLRTAMREAQEGRVSRFRACCPTAKGTQKTWEVMVAPVFDASGCVVQAIAVSRDVTEDHSTADEVARKIAQMETLATAALTVTRTSNLDEVLEAITHTAKSVIGAHQAVVSLTKGSDWSQGISSVALSDKYDRWRDYGQKTDGSGIYAWVCEENLPVRMTQAELEAHPRWRGFGAHAAHHPPMRGWLAAPLIGREGRNLGLIQISDKADGGEFDAADEAILVQLAQLASGAVEQSLAQTALRLSEARFRAAVAAVSGIVWTNDVDGQMMGEQPGWSALTGQAESEYHGFGWSDAVHPEDAQTTVEAWNAAVAERRPFEFEHRVRTAMGAWRRFAIRAIPVFDDVGAIREWVGVHSDVTDLRRQEEELRDLNERLEHRVMMEVANRVKAEDALRQAQKMEAIGQLTGGVAHDFNNLLTVIIGGLDTLGRCGADEEARKARAVDMATRAAQRATGLTNRLLAFSRRQALDPKPLDANILVREMTDMLHRTLGETVELESALAARLWTLEADQNQLESALVNLAVNARDAMPEGGKLTIETSNAVLDESYAATDSEVVPGQYVLIAVSDTGMGMAKDTLEKVFEPFFTTKDVGRGTGLGLSMVYGFVKQSGGHVTIYSEPNLGTTVKLYLPRLRGTAKHEAPAARVAAPRAHAGEVILLVEDNEDVRSYSAMILRELGYDLVEAADADSALAVLGSDQRVDLLFTDVVLPGKSGRVLADAAKEVRPELTVLFTTGYSRNAIVHHGRLDAGVELISKPFTFEGLAVRLRGLLDRR